jgi:hypothetical protein
MTNEQMKFEIGQKVTVDPIYLMVVSPHSDPNTVWTIHDWHMPDDGSIDVYVAHGKALMIVGQNYLRAVINEDR